MRETGSKFFQDNKIRSCSYVKEDKDGNCKAVAFYDKRNQTVYPTRSDITRSWSACTHNPPKPLNAGMGTTKPLTSVHFPLTLLVRPQSPAQPDQRARLHPQPPQQLPERANRQETLTRHQTLCDELRQWEQFCA